MPTPAINDDYRRYVALRLRCHALLSADENADTEAIDDQLAELWGRMNSEQRRSLSGMGADLNWIVDNGIKPSRPSAPEDVERAKSVSRLSATTAHEWLDYLRLYPESLSGIDIANYRASYYRQLGFSEIAEVFSGFATRLIEENTAISRIHSSRGTRAEDQIDATESTGYTLKKVNLRRSRGPYINFSGAATSEYGEHRNPRTVTVHCHAQ